MNPSTMPSITAKGIPIPIPIIAPVEKRLEWTVVVGLVMPEIRGVVLGVVEAAANAD